MARINGRTSGSGGVAHESAHVQNRNAGSPDNPKTRHSTMKIVTTVLVEAFANRMMNIHPSLLPSFPGLDVQKKAIEWGCKLAGCTVHFVTQGVDEGPIILQAAVPILDDDTPDTLAARILEQEHKVYPQAVQLFAEGRLRIEGRRVFIEAGKPMGEVVISPS